MTVSLPKESQILLQPIYQNPEYYINCFALDGRCVNLINDNARPIPIGELNTDVPSVALKFIKIKSWRVDKDSKDILSLALNLII